MDYGRYGFLRVAAVAPVVEVGDPAANAAAILAAYEAEGREGAALVVTPELGLGISPHGTAKRRFYAGQRRFSRRLARLGWGSCSRGSRSSRFGSALCQRGLPPCLADRNDAMIVDVAAKAPEPTLQEDPKPLTRYGHATVRRSAPACTDDRRAPSAR